MLRPINAVIAEIDKIPRATWEGSDPTKPPVLCPSTPLNPVPTGHTPVFDDSSFNQPSSPRWVEAVDAVRRRLAGSTGGGVRGQEVGIDVLAWYVSFHSNRNQWGIYVPLSSLPIVDELHFSHLPIPRAERWQIIWNALLAHESVHFAVDRACAWFELLHHAPISRAVRDRMEYAGPTGGAMLPHSSYFEAEEALANGYMLRALGCGLQDDAAAALRQFVRGQPPGYRDGEVAETDRGFVATAAEVMRGYLAVWSTLWNLDTGNPALDFSQLLPLSDADRTACPIWILDDLDAAGLPPDAVKLFSRITPIEETTAFSKTVKRRHLEGAWERLKARLAEGITNGSDFKKWPNEGDGMWSVRVTDGIRAHLLQPQHLSANPSKAPAWLACKIGGHKEMGHG
jgi:hypothetical protein